jgi:hypothetical protein
MKKRLRLSKKVLTELTTSIGAMSKYIAAPYAAGSSYSHDQLVCMLADIFEKYPQLRKVCPRVAELVSKLDEEILFLVEKRLPIQMHHFQ